jgi:hypothetical protein
MPILPTWFVIPLLEAFSGSHYLLMKVKFIIGSQSLHSLAQIHFFWSYFLQLFCRLPSVLLTIALATCFCIQMKASLQTEKHPLPLPVKSHPCVKSLMKCLLSKDQTFPSYLSLILTP